MDDYYSVPNFKSDEGKTFFNALSDQVGKPKGMLTIAILSTVRLLTIIPESVSSAIISPMVALPLLLNHEDEMVRLIVKTRLQENI